MRKNAHVRRQYVHYLVYYVMAKLLLGEVTAYKLYCSFKNNSCKDSV